MTCRGQLQVSQTAARRFLLESLLLKPGASPPALNDTIDLLEAVQIDPVARVARNQDLVLWARTSHYRPDMLDGLLSQHAVFEYHANQASVMPIRDYPALEGVRRRQLARLQPELARFAPVVKDILHRIDAHGFMPSRAFDSTTKVMGYWDTVSATTKETSHVLNLLCDAGRLMVVGRKAGMRYFDIPERVVPPELMEQAHSLTALEADERLFDKYFRAYHLVNGRDPRLGWLGQPAPLRQRLLSDRLKDGRLQVVRIDNVKTTYYVSEREADRLQFWQSQQMAWRQMVRFLPPLDNLLWDRRRLQDVFGFAYRWELYVPARRRQFGVYAMPILRGDRLIGRIDPQFKRQEGKIIIHNLAWEPTIQKTRTLEQTVQRALEAWAQRLGARSIDWHCTPMP
jgi:uncharacterized protein YcaQ